MSSSNNSNPKKLVIFDLNKTLIKQTSWYELSTAMGVTPEEDEMLYRLGPEKEGVITYHEWIAMLTKIYIKRGKATKDNIENIILNYQLKEGAQDTIKQLRERGHSVAIITGSFNTVADDASHKLGIEHCYNNAYLVYDKNNYLQDILLTWDDLQYKTLMAQSVCRRFGMHPRDIYYVADGDNDENIFNETIGVAVGMGQDAHEPWKQNAIDAGEDFSRDSAISAAKYRISHLKELLDIVK